MTECIFFSDLPKSTVPGVCARGPTLFVEVNNTQLLAVSRSECNVKKGKRFKCFVSYIFPNPICAEGGGGGVRGPTEMDSRHR